MNGKKKQIRRSFAFIMAVIMVLSACFTDLGLFGVQIGPAAPEKAEAKTVKGAKINVSSHVLTTDDVDTQLLKYFQQITNNQKVTVGDMHAYTGDITLPKDVTSLNGIYYADAASSFDISNVNVTKIPDGTFTDCKGATSITMSTAVTEIGDSAFSGCEKLQTINLDKVVSVGNLAFNGCTALSQDTYDKLVDNKELTKIGKSAFASCTALTKLKVPKIKNYENLGTTVYDGCSGATEIDFLDAAIPRIPAEMFQGCAATGVTVKTAGTEGFPVQIESIGNAAFSNCALSSVDLSKCTKLTTIGDRSFYQARNIALLKLPEALTSIGQSAFQSACYGVNVTVEIPGNVTKLGELAFQASGIKQVTFACNNLLEIPEKAFLNCERLQEVTFTNPANSKLKVISQEAFSNTCLQDLSFLSNLTMLEEIGAHAFSLCYKITNTDATDSYGVLTSSMTGITDITIPDCVTKLGVGAFSDNHSLVTVKIGNGIKEIPDECFAAVTDYQENDWKDKAPVKLEKVILPSALTSIGNYSFAGNYSLQTMTYQTGTEQDGVITFPETLEEIGDRAFRACAFFNTSNQDDGQTYKHVGMTTVKLPDNVKKIGEAAFARCSNLNTVSLPKNLEVIPNSLFSNCSISETDMTDDMIKNGYVGLKNVEFPEKLTEIGSYAFNACRAFNLQNGKLPDTLVTIKDHAFYECKSLTKVEFQNALETIGDYAFAECSKTKATTYSIVNTNGELTTASVNVVQEGLGSIDMRFATNLTSIGDYAFSCSAIESFSLGAAIKLEKIGASAFESCTNLTQVNLFDTDGNSGVKSFGSNCFKDCTALNNIKLPYSAELKSSMFSGMCAGSDPSTQLTIAADATAADKLVQIPLFGKQALPVKFFSDSLLAGNMTVQDENKTDLLTETGNNIVSAIYESPAIFLNGLAEGTSTITISAPLKFTHAKNFFTKNVTYTGKAEVAPVPCSELYFTGKRVVTNAVGDKTMYIPYGDSREFTVYANFAPKDTSDQPDTSLTVQNIVKFRDNGLQESNDEEEPNYYEYKFKPDQYGETTFQCKMGKLQDSLVIKTCVPNASIQLISDTVKITSGIEKTYNLAEQVSLQYPNEYAELSKKYPDKLLFTMDEPSPYMTIDESTGVITTTSEVTDEEVVWVTVRSIATYDNSASIRILLVPKPTDFQISEASVGLKQGETKELYIKNDETLKPSTASRRVTWKTSNSKVVSLASDQNAADTGAGIVGSKVILKGVADGTATISATSINGIVKTCPVKVSKDGSAPIVPTPTPPNGGSSGNGNGGGNGGGAGGKKPINVSSITLKTTYPSKVIYLKKGKGYKINSIVAPANTTNRLVWASSNASKVKVSGGYVKGVATGNAMITLTAYNGNSVVKRASIKVVVLKKAVKAKSVKIKGKKKLKVGSSVQLKAVVKPKKCTATIKWTSKAKKIASVDKYGVVTGKKKGTAKIVAKAQPGKKSKVFKIKVTK